MGLKRISGSLSGVLRDLRDASRVFKGHQKYSGSFQGVSEGTTISQGRSMRSPGHFDEFRWRFRGFQGNTLSS